MAGKTVKCPGCQKPLKIPGETAPAKAAAKPANGQPAAGAAKPAAAKPAATKAAAPKPAPAKQPAAVQPVPATSDSLFDEIGLAPAVEGTRPCPGCTEPLAIEAVVCVKCGYNTRLGRRMATMKSGGEGGGEGGHGAVAQDLLDRAAEVIDGDAEEEIKKTKAGTPWWVFLVVLIALVGFGAFMLSRKGSDEDKDKEGKKTGWLDRHPPAVVRTAVG